MITQTWAYGTVRFVDVVSVETEAAWQIVSVIDTAKIGYILVEQPGTYQCKPGDVGTITFTKGGPTGGFWKLTIVNSKGGSR